MSELYMMVTITNRKYMSKFAALYRENQIEVGTVSLGMGTASSSILDYMGLEDDEKSNKPTPIRRSPHAHFHEWHRL